MVMVAPLRGVAGLFKNSKIMVNPKHSAFPFTENGENSVSTGIDVRTWMATQFMASMLIEGDGGHYADRADRAVKAAEWLIKSLNKPQDVKP